MVSLAGALPDNTPRILATIDALVGGLADEAIARPAGELGADHQLRPDPICIPQYAPRRDRRERLLIGRETGKRRQQLRAGVAREPGADLARVAKRASLMDADEER